MNTVIKLSESVEKNGVTAYLLGVIGFVIITLISSLVYIINQNSLAIKSIPRDMGILNSKLENIDKKIDLIFLDNFKIIKK